MAVSLEDCIKNTYKVGDEIPLSRGKTGTIKQIYYDAKGNIKKLDVLDGKGQLKEVPI